MKLSQVSLLLFGVSVVLLVALTLSERALVGISPGGEKLITFLLLILPAGIGTVLGAISLGRKEGQAWLAIIGLVLNSLFAIFHLMILVFAG